MLLGTITKEYGGIYVVTNRLGKNDHLLLAYNERFDRIS